jgi:HPt (histidine-containing phosphotransfer) domain-containing protein
MQERDFISQLIQDLGVREVALILSVFDEDIELLTARIVACAVAGDAQGFRRANHSLAGAAGAVGAATLEQACRAAMIAPDNSTLPADADGALPANAGADMVTRSRGILALSAEAAATLRGIMAEHAVPPSHDA